MLAFRFSSFSHSGFRILLILDAGRTVWILFDMGYPGIKLCRSPLIKVTGYENDGPVHWLMMKSELFPLCLPLMPTIGTLWLSYAADIKYRPNNPDVLGASNYLSYG